MILINSLINRQLCDMGLVDSDSIHELEIGISSSLWKITLHDELT